MELAYRTKKYFVMTITVLSNIREHIQYKFYRISNDYNDYNDDLQFSRERCNKYSKGVELKESATFLSDTKRIR